MREFHFANADGRDTRIAFGTTRAPAPPKLGQPGLDIQFRRYLATSELGTHESLVARHGDDYGQALIDGDPEIDMEVVGRAITQTMVVYLSSDGDVLHAPPEVVEVLFGPDGAERERRVPVDAPANVNDELPVRLSSRRMPLADVVRRFVFQRTVQLKHVDGLTYDYLHNIATELAASGQVAVLGAGARGRDPLVFSTNGTPWRAFVEGRVDGERYQLLVHLSNQELKRPEAT